jgi:hypothetical protein
MKPSGYNFLGKLCPVHVGLIVQKGIYFIGFIAERAA